MGQDVGLEEETERDLGCDGAGRDALPIVHGREEPAVAAMARERGDVVEEHDAPVRARVKGGRLLVDEPTDLPDGLVVSLAIVDDDLDHADRAALEASIEESYAQADRGELSDAREVLASLRSRTK